MPIFLSKIYFRSESSNTFARTAGVHSFLDFKSQEGKKPGYLFRIGTGRRIVMLKEAELFSEFPYPLSPQQITLFFLDEFVSGFFTNGVGRYFSHGCSPVL
jgi:hypothetical protein